MLKFADIFNKGPNFNPMQFIRKSSYILTPKTPLIGRLGGPEARMVSHLFCKLVLFCLKLSYLIALQVINTPEVLEIACEKNKLIKPSITQE